MPGTKPSGSLVLFRTGSVRTHAPGEHQGHLAVIGRDASLVTGVQRAGEALERREVSLLEVEWILHVHAADADRPHREPARAQPCVHLVERRDEVRR